MGLKKGVVSFTRFRVANPLPDNFSVLFDEKIRAFSFRNFFLENEEKSMGWTGFQDILDTGFSYASHSLGDYRIFSLRVDRKAIPGALFRLRFLQEQQKVLAERETKRLYREEKNALRDTIRQELLKRTPSVPSLYDICWSLSGGMVYVFSHAGKVLDDFQDFFRETLDMDAVLHCPWVESPSQENTGANAPPAKQGREFLTWLWFKSEERDGQTAVEGQGEIGMTFVRRMVLESGEGENTESVVCRGRHASLSEGKEALRQGKTVREARLVMEIDGAEWEFTVKADLFQFQSMKLPADDEADEKRDEAEEEGRLLERIYLLEKAVGTIDRLFSSYAERRLSDQWDAEAARMNAWINR
jgi:hypothetical protein